MKNKMWVFILFMMILTTAYGQETEGNFIKDSKSGCTVWFKHTFPEDSVTWSGNCKNGFAFGPGTMIGYTRGKQSSKYTGYMLNGKPHGKGKFTFGDRKLEGNFVNGEPLFLKKKNLEHLYKNIVSETDSQATYVGDNNLQQLYYHALVPEGKLKGALILMCGTWETTEHLISSNQTLFELAYNKGLAVLVLSINQRLTLTDEIIGLMNQMFVDAIRKYTIPEDKMIIGGWSMGGLFSIRYTELSISNPALTAIKPAAVFSCDGPADLEHLYYNFQKKKDKFPSNREPFYGISELEKYCGGNPAQSKEKYIYFSNYSHELPDGGNAKYLKNIPVRIYADVDPNWWMDNREVDGYDLNMLDQTAMIQLLNNMGNNKAEFINAFQKGYRLEGNRHPHSWSIVEPNECMQWISKCLNLY
jgi:hypothetical protein